MVGSSLNRSPSPGSARPNPNPNSRSNNQEKDGVGARKSFGGYPFAKSSLISQQKGLIPNTPVNSPAEYARRSSFGRESGGGVSFRDHDQKENEKDHNIKPVARAKSPSILTTKGAKHFMSPTISAASKINPSPRKKVLGERNEAIRTSASLSDGKFHFFSTNSLDFDDETESKSVMERPPCSTTPISFDKAANEVHCSEPEKLDFRYQNGSCFGFGEVKAKAIEADLVVLSPEVAVNAVKSSEGLPLSEMPKMVADHKLESGIKSGAYSSQCTIAPLDADPSLPPYDPKNNYLSPRPQFLHYNPNWRTESYANQGLRLEDEFTSESASETDNSTENSSEEVLSEESLIEQEVSSEGISHEEIQPSSETNTTVGEQLEEVVSQEEMPPSSETNATVGEQLEEVVSHEEMPPSSETNPTVCEQVEENQEMVEAKIEPSSRWFKNWKAVAVLFLFLLGCMSMSLTAYPGMGDVLHRDEIIAHIYSDPHIVVVAENLNDLIQNVKLWSARSLEYLSQVLQNAREVNRFSSLKFDNLTAWEVEEDRGYVVHEFQLEPYFEKLEDELQTVTAENAEAVEIQGYCEQEDNQSFTQIDTVVPEDHEIAVEAESTKVDDSEPEEMEEIPMIKDGTSTQMQSYLVLEYNDTPAEEAELIKAFDSEPVEVEENSVLDDNEAVNAEMTEQKSSVVEPEEIIQELKVDEPQSEPVNAEMAEQELSVAEPENMVHEFKVDELQTDVMVEALSPPEVLEIKPEVITASKPSEETDSSPVDAVQPVDTNITPSAAQSFVLKSNGEKPQLLEAIQKNQAPVAAAVALVVMSLIAAVMYMKPKNVSQLADQLAPETDKRQLAPETGKHKHTAASKMEHSVHETASSWSGPMEVDMIGEPCPSEMSSFQNSAYTKNTQNGGDEAHSLQKNSKKKYKRESLASSSSEYTMNSSYRSFTTYSIIHPKRGDDDVVTPVRRSGRIRSKVTSP